MSQNIFRPPQDTPIIVVESDASLFKTYVQRTTLVAVITTGKLAVLMESGQATDSLNTTNHVSLGIPDSSAGDYVQHRGSENPGDIPQYDTRQPGPTITPSGHTSDDIQDLKDKVNDPVTGLDPKLNQHLTDYSNPHRVTKAQVGLGNADDTSDADKPISDATQDALDDKADLNGNPTEVFRVAPATQPDHAPRWEQISSLRDGALNYRGTWRTSQDFYPGEDTAPPYSTSPPASMPAPGDEGFFWEVTTADYDKDGRWWDVGEWIVYNGGEPALGASWDKINRAADYSFIGAPDTPPSYAGHAGKTLKVTAAEDAVEFVQEGSVEALKYESYATNGQTTIVLNEDVHVAALYSLNGVVQSKTAGEYTSAGDTITLNVPMLEGDRYEVVNYVDSPGVTRTEALMADGDTFVRTNANQAIGPAVTVAVNGNIRSWYSYEINAVNDYQLDFQVPFNEGDMVVVTNYK